MSEKGPKKSSQDYIECREIFKELIDEGLTVVRIIRDSGISINLAKRLAEDLNVPLSSKPAASNAEASTSKASVKTSITGLKSEGPPSKLNSQQASSKASGPSKTVTAAPKEEAKSKPWRCPNWPRCEKYYQSKTVLDYHLEVGCKAEAGRVAETPAPTEKFTCPHGCGKQYASKNGLDYHLQGKCEARRAPPANNEQKLFICKVPGCTNRFSTLTGVTHHLMTSHGKLGQDLAQAMAS